MDVGVHPAKRAALAAAGMRPPVHRTLPLPFTELPYTIHAWSSYSASYHPNNILVDKPMDQSSRWSSGSNNQMQFVTIKLDKPAVVGTITFGKYHKGHVCNLREFKVYAGLSPDTMVEILHSGLRNDDEAETFPVRHRVGDAVFPCQYVKIVPLLAWGANFNFSIWYVMLRGINDPAFVREGGDGRAPAMEGYNAYREHEALRLCLKHLRQRNYLDVYDTLRQPLIAGATRQRSHVQLEDPLLTALHQQLVIEGDFAAVEQKIREAAQAGLFDDYIAGGQYKPHWRRLLPQPDEPSPGMRGGHQMCIDTVRRRIYLYGGWDGFNDLADLWAYDLARGRWELLSPDTAADGGPGARSCHKICLDQQNGVIYVFGGYVDPEQRGVQPLPSDFYAYHIDTNSWECLSADASLENGPTLIYDHEMCFHSERNTIYIFGGRSVTTRSKNGTEDEYSGLYSYHVPTRAWRCIRSDESQPASCPKLKSRIGHSMLLNPRENVLYIFAGQRNKEYLSDFFVYDIAHDQIVDMRKDVNKTGGPDAGFTQRATMDLDLEEIYMFSGLVREKGSVQEVVKNSFWVYNIRRDQWSKVYHNENADAMYWMRMEMVEPCPRFAHQLVYDPTTRTHYLFGGNPGEDLHIKPRLDDFWELKLARPTPADIVRKALFLLRRRQFHEMCEQATAGGKSLLALRFLQQQVGEVVDHSDPEESAQFRALSSMLFQHRPASSADAVFAARTAVYEEILQFFPESFKQPKDSLIDLVRL